MTETELNQKRDELAELAYAEFRVGRENGGKEEFEELCKKHPELDAELRGLHANWDFVAGAIGRLDHSSHLRPNPDSDGFTKRVVERLSGRTGAFERYRIDGKLGEGGQGAILRVWDGDLGRKLAMKVMHSRKASGGNSPPKSGSRALGRFLEEAQVTGQLDHPGIVPVHELGLDEQGRVYFTMKLVKGESLKKVIDRVHKGDAEWSITRALGVLMKVCDATAYAHSKGVLHRDIKPSNVMVGRFGEVHLMDWGLAKVLGRDEKFVESQEPKFFEFVHSDRSNELETPDSPLFTADGDVIGTPAYMSLEQASGKLSLLGPATDVYSIGAMLYQLLSGEVPYMPKGMKLRNYDVLCAVVDGPPKNIHDVASSAPPELLAICEKAMQREIDERYPDVSEMGEDLRAYLENRVVRAHRTGAAVEFRKWVRRNRAMAVAAGVLLAVLITAGFVVANTERGRREQAERDRDERLIASLPDRVEQLGPLHPDSVPAMESWLRDAEQVAPELADYEEKLRLLEARIATVDRVEVSPSYGAEELANVIALKRYQIEHWQGIVGQKQAGLVNLRDERERDTSLLEIDILKGELAFLEPKLRDLEIEAERERTWTVVEKQTASRLDLLTETVWSLRALRREPGGLIAKVRKEQELAQSVPGLSTGAADSDWDYAIASIADESSSPLYEGLELKLQLGLVPLGPNDAGLWEFWHVLSGDKPQIRMEGGYEIRPETGLVFVLIPGGEYFAGAQTLDESIANYCSPTVCRDRVLPGDEGTVCSALLDPYFFSKFEMTQRQWKRLAGENPSRWFPGSDYVGHTMIASTHPVESVSWSAAVQALSRWSLTLPTEAQWEAAARGGTSGPFWWGDSLGMPFAVDNFADVQATIVLRGKLAKELLDDGWALHAPVDTFLPNPWGLVSISGNVAEWCLDWFEEKPYETTPAEGSGLLTPKWSQSKSYRGGGYLHDEVDLRVSRRSSSPGGNPREDVGVRPVQRLDL